MNKDKAIGRIIGALFLFAIIGNLIGSELLDAIVMSSDYYLTTYPNKTNVIIGVLFEILVSVAVVGIGVLSYQIFKKYNETVATGYLAIRIVEAAITIPLVLCSLTLLTLSQNHLGGSPLDISNFELLGTLAQELRTWTLMIYIIFFALGGLLFYSLTFRTRLLPRYISIWGLIGLTLAIAGTVYNLFNNNSLPPEMYAMPMGLNEIFLGFWLLVRGFNTAPQNSPETSPETSSN